jgi:hypothetical protein
MRGILALFLIVALEPVVLPNAAVGNDDIKPCGNVSIVSLGIYPDPLADGNPITEWNLRVHSEGEETCSAPIHIVEVEREIVAAETSALIKAGTNDLKLAPRRDYRLTGDTRCFNVVWTAPKSGTKPEVPKSFCALRIDNWWSMR